MKLSLFLSASATFFLAAAAATDEPIQTLKDALANFKHAGGVDDLGRDGVLRSLNPARDTVVDYVQLTPAQIAEYLASMEFTTQVYDGVDGHTVTTQTALWSVPAYISPRTPNALLLKSAPKGRSARALFGKRDDLCNPKSGCDEAEDCWAQNCANCREATHECVGGPTGCLTTPSQCWGEL